MCVCVCVCGGGCVNVCSKPICNQLSGESSCTLTRIIQSPVKPVLSVCACVYKCVCVCVFVCVCVYVWGGGCVGVCVCVFREGGEE